MSLICIVPILIVSVVDAPVVTGAVKTVRPKPHDVGFPVVTCLVHVKVGELDIVSEVGLAAAEFSAIIPTITTNRLLSEVVKAAVVVGVLTAPRAKSAVVGNVVRVSGTAAAA